MFHHFHNSWVYKLSDRLNDGILPPGFYAAGEQIIGDVEPDLLTFQSEAEPDVPWAESGAIAVADHPPKVSLTSRADEPLYVSKQDHVVVRSSEGDRLVALIEIVSRGNKDSRARFHAFTDRVTAAIERGCHVLVVDLFPPGTLDPEGIHGAIWEQLVGGKFEAPLMLVSYQAAAEPTAWVEPMKAGDALPEMPLFLDEGWYVPTPLEETYEHAWRGFPDPWKDAVEAS